MHIDGPARWCVLAAASPDGALYGIASWRQDDDLLLGDVLRVETMIALEVRVSNPVRTSLCNVPEKQCSELGAVLSLPFRRDDMSWGYPRNGKQAGSRKQALFIFDWVSTDCTGPQSSSLMRLAGR